MPGTYEPPVAADRTPDSHHRRLNIRIVNWRPPCRFARHRAKLPLLFKYRIAPTIDGLKRKRAIQTLDNRILTFDGQEPGLHDLRRRRK